MARHIFGGGTSDYLADTSSGAWRNTGPVEVTFWDAPTGGNQHTDLLVGGQPAASYRVGSSGHWGRAGELQGPDGVEEMWMQVPGHSVRYRVTRFGAQGVTGPGADVTGAEIEAARDEAQAAQTAAEATAQGVADDAASAEAAAQQAQQAVAAGVAVVATSEAAGTNVNPAAVDNRPLARPARRVPPAARLATPRRNLWVKTEDVASGNYSVATVEKTTDTIVVDGIALTRLGGAGGFYAQMSSNLGGLGLPILTAGRRYLLSYYVVARGTAARWFWMRSLAAGGGAAGHGKRMVEPNVLTRVWALVEATSTTQVADFSTPASGLGSGSATNPAWFYQANGSAADMYVGGFQIEDVGTTAKAGIAWIGDSTRAGSSGTNDAQNSREVPGIVEALLGCYTFNRAVGGQRLDQMDARWATDITPLAGVCKYVVVQGGINDISQGRTLAQMQASTSSMATKAATDGLMAVYETITPFAAAADDPAKETLRLNYNAWLKSTFARVIDSAQVITDPYQPDEIRRTSTAWPGDRTHYGLGAKRAIAEHIAAQPWWDLPAPSPYQAVIGTTWDGWVAPTGTATRTGFDTASVTLPQLAERVKALLDDLASASARQG